MKVCASRGCNEEANGAVCPAHEELRRASKKAPIVDFDGQDWRIYVYFSGRGEGDDLQNDINWWPLEWLRFASKEVAEDHLAMYGAK